MNPNTENETSLTDFRKGVSHLRVPVCPVTPSNRTFALERNEFLRTHVVNIAALCVRVKLCSYERNDLIITRCEQRSFHCCERAVSTKASAGWCTVISSHGIFVYSTNKTPIIAVAVFKVQTRNCVNNKQNITCRANIGPAKRTNDSSALFNSYSY